MQAYVYYLFLYYCQSANFRDTSQLHSSFFADKKQRSNSLGSLSSLCSRCDERKKLTADASQRCDFTSVENLLTWIFSDKYARRDFHSSGKSYQSCFIFNFLPTFPRSSRMSTGLTHLFVPDGQYAVLCMWYTSKKVITITNIRFKG